MNEKTRKLQSWDKAKRKLIYETNHENSTLQSSAGIYDCGWYNLLQCVSLKKLYNLNWEPSFLFSSPILTNYRGSLACFCLRLSPLAYFYNPLNDVSTRCLVVSLVLMALSVFLLVYFQHRSSPTRRRVTADTDLYIELETPSQPFEFDIPLKLVNVVTISGQQRCLNKYFQQKTVVPKFK